MTHREAIHLAGARDGGIGLPLVPFLPDGWVMIEGYLVAAHTLAPSGYGSTAAAAA